MAGAGAHEQVERCTFLYSLLIPTTHALYIIPLHPAPEYSCWSARCPYCLSLDSCWSACCPCCLSLASCCSFTLEASFAGANFGTYKNLQFTIEMFQDVGVVLCDALLDYCDPDQTKVGASVAAAFVVADGVVAACAVPLGCGGGRGMVPLMGVWGGGWSR